MTRRQSYELPTFDTVKRLKNLTALSGQVGATQGVGPVHLADCSHPAMLAAPKSIPRTAEKLDRLKRSSFARCRCWSLLLQLGSRLLNHFPRIAQMFFSREDIA